MNNVKRERLFRLQRSDTRNTLGVVVGIARCGHAMGVVDRFLPFRRRRRAARRNRRTASFKAMLQVQCGIVTSWRTSIRLLCRRSMIQVDEQQSRSYQPDDSCSAVMSAELKAECEPHRGNGPSEQWIGRRLPKQLFKTSGYSDCSVRFTIDSCELVRHGEILLHPFVVVPKRSRISAFAAKESKRYAADSARRGYTANKLSTVLRFHLTWREKAASWQYAFARINLTASSLVGERSPRSHDTQSKIWEHVATVPIRRLGFAAQGLLFVPTLFDVRKFHSASNALRRVA